MNVMGVATIVRVPHDQTATNLSAVNSCSPSKRNRLYGLARRLTAALCQTDHFARFKVQAWSAARFYGPLYGSTDILMKITSESNVYKK